MNFCDTLFVEALSCFFTVISGILVYILSQRYDEYRRKPRLKYYEIRSRIKYYLLLHANLYTNPLQLADKNTEAILKRYSEASDDMRKVGAELAGIISSLPMTIGKTIPKKQELNDVVRYLIGISNSFYMPYNVNDTTQIRDASKDKKEIERILNI